jgi:hypothetical protein
MAVASDRTLTHGYWLVAFVDLLGQQEAFMKTDYLPDREDPTKRDAFMEAVKASVGVVRRMRRILDTFRTALASNADAADSPLRDLPPEGLTRAKGMLERRVNENRWSDGVMLSCPLQPGEGHTVPILGVYDVLCTCAALMLVQLATGNPIRGGLDVGTGIDIDGELFGAALVKAYRLESTRAQHPRLVVGRGLVDYLKASTRAPGSEIERQFERRMATGVTGLIMQDEDDEWIVDYAGPKAREFIVGNLKASDIPIFAHARAFAHRSRTAFQAQGAGGEKLFARYSKLVRYLDARASLWGDTT